MVSLGFRRAVEMVVRAMSGLPRFVPLSGPLTSTSWDGDAHGSEGPTLIDLSAVFGVPAGVKAVLVHVTVNDSASAANDCVIMLSPDSAVMSLGVSCGGLANDKPGRGMLVVPCNVDGDIYYRTFASGAGALDVALRIWGYWI